MQNVENLSGNELMVELKNKVNVLELALYSPFEEVTFEARGSLQSLARDVVLLVNSLAENGISLPNDTAQDRLPI